MDYCFLLSELKIVETRYALLWCSAQSRLVGLKLGLPLPPPGLHILNKFEKRNILILVIILRFKTIMLHKKNASYKILAFGSVGHLEIP